MAALLDPSNRMRRSIKWALVAHTVAIFSFTTISCGVECTRRSGAYIDNREYPGVRNVFEPGPFGYTVSEGASAIATVDCLVVPLNQWFIDGLLVSAVLNSMAQALNGVPPPAVSLLYPLFRESLDHYPPGHDVPRHCWYVVKSPCKLTVAHSVNTANTAMGIAYIYENGTVLIWNPTITNIFLSYNFIAVSLNVLLTAMIIIRILQHRRNFQSAVGTSGGGSGLYTAIIAMLIESCAPYTVTYLLYIIPIALGSYINFVFAWIFGAFQVRNIFALLPDIP